MPDAYRVCIIVQPGNPHAHVFDEVGALIKSSLASLNVSCDMACNDCAPDRVNILLGWHLLSDIEVVGSARIIPYQLEQLDDTRWEGFGPARRAIMERALDVWDYSEENVTFLQSHGVRARRVPLGYHECLERIGKAQEKDIDVLFYGSADQRRKRVLSEIAADSSMKVCALFGVYGKQRDEYISRSKIVLNVHFYPTQIFEAVRVSYLLNNACCVVSETSTVYPYPGVDLPLFPYEILAEKCREILRDSSAMETYRQTCHDQFRKLYPMSEMVRNAILM